MTIRIEIKNDDNRENAIVIVKVLSKTASGAFAETSEPSRTLAGQEKAVFWVHQGQRLMVEEVEVSHG